MTTDFPPHLSCRQGRKRGRPSVGRRVRLTSSTFEHFEAYAVHEQVTKAALARRLIEENMHFKLEDQDPGLQASLKALQTLGAHDADDSGGRRDPQKCLDVRLPDELAEFVEEKGAGLIGFKVESMARHRLKRSQSGEPDVDHG